MISRECPHLIYSTGEKERKGEFWTKLSLVLANQKKGPNKRDMRGRKGEDV